MSDSSATTHENNNLLNMISMHKTERHTLLNDQKAALKQFNNQRATYYAELTNVGHTLVTQKPFKVSPNNVDHYMAQHDFPVLAKIKEQSKIRQKNLKDYEDHKEKYDSTTPDALANVLGVLSASFTSLYVLVRATEQNNTISNSIIAAGIGTGLVTFLAVSFLMKKTLPKPPEWTDEAKAESAEKKKLVTKSGKKLKKLKTRKKNTRKAILALYNKNSSALNNPQIAKEAENVVIHLTNKLNNPALS